MKDYLVTWYGITDFRSSLGFEKSGPILGALADGNYTDVIVLGYSKQDDCISEAEFESRLEEVQNSETPEDKFKFTYEYANCAAAHKHFIKFLGNKIVEMGKTISIGFIPITLSQLNDSEGIYSAAVQALQSISDLTGDRRVSIFLSPGTPLMAFSWALAAFKFPSIPKRLIASSDPRKPPMAIMPPKEWMEWNAKQNPIDQKDNNYDVIYTLFGEQRIPALLGINQFSSKKYVFITSGNYNAQCMKDFLPTGAEFSEIRVDAFSPKDIFEEILRDAQQYSSNSRIGFNLTGGTKLMYAGAINACRKLGGVPFYVGGKDLTLVYLNDFKTEALKPIEKVDSFILLNSNGLGISNHGRTGADDVDSIDMTNEMWKSREHLNKLYFEIQQMQHKDCYYSLSLENPTKPKIVVLADSQFCISTKQVDYAFEDETQFSKYILGEWFEEYIYNNLYPLYEKGKILDIRHGIKVDFSLETLNQNPNHKIYQEMDVVFTNGKKLFIVECKTGPAELPHVERLSTITRYYGGIEGVGILAYTKKPESEILLKKISETPNVKMVAGEGIVQQIKNVIGCEDD